MNTLWYKWDEMRRDVNVLCRDIAIEKFDPEVIVGLSRGGLTPGVMMSHWFNKPFKPIKTSLRDFPEWEDFMPRKTDKRILIVDDICDSGATFERMQNYLLVRSDGCDVRYASLWWNNECDFEPNYYVQEVAKDTEKLWIHFPWEQWWNAPV